jgi:hypothetical protein
MIWFTKPKAKTQSNPDLATSILYNEATFYNQFIIDLTNAMRK